MITATNSFLPYNKQTLNSHETIRYYVDRAYLFKLARIQNCELNE
jgi:hypothetical protein